MAEAVRHSRQNNFHRHLILKFEIFDRLLPHITHSTRHGHPEEARQGPSGQILQIGQREGLQSTSRLQADPAEQKVPLSGED
jgi:hypothetical protein